MDFDRRRSRAEAGATLDHAPTPAMSPTDGPAPIQRKRAQPDHAAQAASPGGARYVPLTEAFAVQLKALATADDSTHVHAAAARGTATPATQLPYMALIQHSFGRHDVSGVKAHVGAEATASTRAMGAQAYATGDHVVLGDRADLHTAAHEAAHVVQQRAGVQLKGGVGEVGDAYERHADTVADRVVSGGSAERLLDEVAPAGKGSSRPGGVQMAGHAGVILFGTIKDGDTDTGTVLKRVEDTEYQQYRGVQAKQDAGDEGALGTFPRVYAVYRALPDNFAGQYDPEKLAAFRSKHDDESRYIEIASVKANASDKVKDFKIGTSTTNAQELVEHGHLTTDKAAGKKVAREDVSDALTESSRFGLRDSDEMRTAKGLGVFIGKKFNSKAKFLSVNTLSSIQKQVQKRPYAENARVFSDLNTIENYIASSDTVYLASSLVMNWSDNHEQDSVKLIDLAHPLTADKEGFAEAKTGMLHGIQNLRRILQGEGLASARPEASGSRSGGQSDADDNAPAKTAEVKPDEPSRAPASDDISEHASEHV